ncbi:MAG: tetratricopeptide repeat protein [Planctomycetales bacterium]|nr:tetratricopeptide repeat protein [Planctomycetales bacterium]
MDAFTWLTAGRNWVPTALLAGAAMAALVQPAAADEPQSSKNTIVLVADGPADAVLASDQVDDAAAAPEREPIPWSSSDEGVAELVNPSQMTVVGDGPTDEPLRAQRPKFVTDSEVIPASLYGSGAAYAGPQQPLRRSTTLQLRPQTGGRSLADRLHTLEGDDEEPAPKPVQVGARRPSNRQSRPRQRQQEVEPAAQPTPPIAPVAERLLQAHQISLAAESEGEYSEIITLCSDAVRAGAEGDQRQFATQLAAWALNRRGEIRTESGHDALAMADFRAALDYDPNHWRTLHNRGVTYAQQGLFAEAFDDVSRVIELNPDFAKAFANRGTLFVQAGDLPSAIADYSRAIEIDDQLVAALVGRARVLHMQGEWDKAVADFDAAIEIGEPSAAVYCSRGDLLADLGRYGDALADYAQAIELDDACAHAYRNGSWLLATCPDADYRDAENALLGTQQALECGYGDRHAALDALAAALASAERFDEAIATEQQALDVAPAELREGYEYRLQLYEAHEPYRTSPVAD